MTLDGQVSRVAGLLGLFGGIVFALAATGAGAKQPAQARQPEPARRKLEGASVCKDCHDRADPKTVELYQETLSFEFVKLNESKIWSAYDLHSQAYRGLLTEATAQTVKKEKPNPLAEKMEANLKKQKGPEYTVAADPLCLACHCSSFEPLTRESVSKATAAAFWPLDGVGCEMCHGHGAKYRSLHADTEIAPNPAAGEAVRTVRWRTWDPAKKAEHGLVNLRDPATAAAKCASCHIGNRDEGRFVTHEMFAAGHPPLPPLDLIAFSRELPPHWGTASELPFIRTLSEKDPTKCFELYHVRTGESAVVRRFAESAIGTLRASMELTKQLAAEAKTKQESLDFAAFDCYSCHHNLKYPSDRQARGYDGPPGRPQFRPAFFALARLVAEHASGIAAGSDLAGSADRLDKLQKELALAFGNKTYGDPDAIVKAATEIEKWCSSTASKLASVKYTPDETKKLLALVAEAASRAPSKDPSSVPASRRAVADPELAQLYFWAAETLVRDLDKSKQTAPDAIVTLRRDLDARVVTSLRDPASIVLPSSPEHVNKPVAERISARMDRFNNFDGKAFREAFGKLPVK
jgi:hypothetical protein